MDGSKTLYSAREVARIFQLTDSRVRYWAQTGLVNPTGSRGGRRLYTFRDLVGIRAVKELLDRGIPLQRVRKNLAGLREALPELDEPLARLRVKSDGERVVVEHREGDFEPITGQLLLDFSIDDVDENATRILTLPGPTKDKAQAEAPEPGGDIRVSDDEDPGSSDLVDTAYGWFLKGCMLDQLNDRGDEAMDAYTRALELDPGLASAQTNLGNLHYLRGERAEALRCYQQACALEPDQPEAAYNLANLLEEEGELEDAADQYRRVLLMEPEFRDAHFNLALALERLGRSEGAAEHWQAYLSLADGAEIEDEEEQWMETARRQLDRLRGGSGDSP